VLTSTKLILGGFLGVLACLALVLIAAMAGNRGSTSATTSARGVTSPWRSAVSAASHSSSWCSRPSWRQEGSS